MINKYDADKIRERLNIYMDKYGEDIKSIAIQCGINHLTVQNFLHGRFKARRKTLEILVEYLEHKMKSLSEEIEEE